MARGGLKLTGAWSRWSKLLDPDKFRKRLEHEVRRATQRNALYVVREMRKAIQERKYAENSVITIAAKAPKDKPLVDTGALFGALTYELLSEYEAFVGIKRSAKSKDGGDLVNIAAALHEGFTLRVTPAMRAAVFAKMAKNPKSQRVLNRMKGGPGRGSDGRFTKGKFETGAPAVDVWVIPARPFIREVLERRDVRKHVYDEWTEAVKRALLAR